MEKKLEGNYTRMLQAVLNKSWRQHLTKQQLCGHQPPITKTIQIRPTRHAGHCWRSKDELISDVHLWIPSDGRAKIWRPARTYLRQLCADKRCSLEDLPGAMDNREGWRERERERESGKSMLAVWHDDDDDRMNFVYIYIYIYIYTMNISDLYI